MALKFRRGTTAQKSGSLAFGEPYVNTTLGTLQLGLETGDVTLLINSSSQGISGSSLNITGDAKIDGNLTLGGNISIGDQTSDVVNVVASLSSSLIPSATNAFDLGSSTRIWRDLYISTGSIKFIDGGSVVNTLSSNTLTTILQSTSSTDDKFIEIANVTGSLIASASAAKTTNDTQTTSITNINAFTSSINTTIKSKLDTDGVISGSSQVTLSNVSGFTTYSSSIDSRVLTEKGRVDAILSASDADKDSFAEIVALINSVDTTNDNAFASFYTASVGRLNNLESTSASVNLSISSLNTFTSSQESKNSTLATYTGSVNTKFTEIANVSGSLIASASNAYATNVAQDASITNINTATASLNTSVSNINSHTSSVNTKLTEIGVVSGSLISTASNHEQRLDTFESISGSFAKTNQSNTFGDQQIISGNLDVNGKITSKYAVSASVVYVGKSDGNSEVQLVNSTNGRGFHLISYNASSFSIHSTDTSGSVFRIDSGSRYHSHFFGDVYVLSGSVVASQGITGSIAAYNGVVSGSSQVVLQSTTGFTSYDSALATITGSLITSASTAKTTNDSQDVSITNINTTTASLNVSVSNLNSFSSSELTKNSTLATYTGSVETRLTEIGIVSGSLIASASTAKSTNDSQGISLTNLNSYTASLQAGIQMTGSTVSILGDLKVYGTQSVITSTNVQIQDNILYLAPTASIDNDLGIVGHYNDGTYRHAGIFMDASDGHSWKVFNGLTDETSAQVDVNGTGFTLADFKAGAITGTSFNGAINATNGIVSGSSQIDLTATTNYASGILTRLNAVGVVSGSSQITAGSTTNFATDVKTQLNSNTVVSGSSQITAGSTTNFATDVKTQLNSNTVVSGSSQIDLTATTNYASGILTRLNAVGVVSGSSQVIGILSSLNSYTSSNDSTNTTQTSRLDQLSTASGSAIGRLNNIESFSSSALTRLTNLEGTDISITLTGDVTGTGTITNLANVSFATTIAANSVALGTDTTGDYVTNLVAGTGVTITNNSGEGATPTVAIGQAVATSSSPTFAGLTINGAITATGDITAYYSSDKRFKSNIQIIPNALEKVNKLNGVTWTWNEDVNKVTKTTPNTGLIAQEVQEVLPEVVMEREDGHLGLDYSKMMGLMVEAIKEQQTQIHNLTLQIQELKKQKGL